MSAAGDPAGPLPYYFLLMLPSRQQTMQAISLNKCADKAALPTALTSTHLQSRSYSLTVTASDQRLPSVVFKDFMESVLVLGAPVEGRLLLIFSLSASACSKRHLNVPG